MAGRRSGRGRWLSAVVVAALLGATCAAYGKTATADGATPPKLPEPLTKETIRDLVARLSDAEVRQLLIAQLDRAAAPAPHAPPAGDVMSMIDDTAAQSERMMDLAAGLVALPAVLRDVRTRLLEGRGAGHGLLVAALFAVMLAAGVLVERLVERGLRGARRAHGDHLGESLGAQAGRFVLRLVLDLVTLLAFVVGALAVFFALHQGHLPTRQVVLTYLLAVVLVRLTARVSLLVLAPGVPARRLLPLGDGAASRLHHGVVGLAGVYGFGVGTLHLLRSLGVPEATAAGLNVLVALVFLVVALATIWRVRTDIARLIRGTGAAGPLRRLLAEVWPVLATAYLIIIVLARLAEVLAGQSGLSRAPILSVVLLVVLPLVDMVLVRMVAARFAGGSGAVQPGGLQVGGTIEPVLRRVVHVLVMVVGLVVLAELWNLDLFTMAEEGLGARVSGSVLEIAITILLAWTLWELAQAAIARRMAAEAGPVSAERGEEGSDRPATRLLTLLPLLRMLLLTAIVVMATLSILSALGVNILPLLAGAGVFGLAIGFGSQTLVRDVVSGAFFLMDDAFRLGEYIEAGDSKGTVEKITIRSLHIRHHRGALNIVPYGEIKRLRNTSRDWMIMALEFRLPFDTDLLKVKKIIKRIGEEIAADPELGPDLLQPLKSQGVMATDDAGLVVRAKFMAKPTSTPYLIRREAYNRILKAFAAEGIRFASRHVTVLAPGEELAAGAGSGMKRAAAAAATAAEDPGPQA